MNERHTCCRSSSVMRLLFLQHIYLYSKSRLYKKPQLGRVRCLLLATVGVAACGVRSLWGVLPGDMLLQKLGRGKHLPACQARVQVSAAFTASWRISSSGGRSGQGQKLFVPAPPAPASAMSSASSPSNHKYV